MTRLFPRAAASALVIFALCSLTTGAVAAQPAAQQPAPIPAPAPAGRGGPPPGSPPPGPPVNLQVLPRTTPRPEVVAVMRAFTTGLGVTCDYCHVQDGTGRNDFANDGLPTKRAARAMLVMVSQINQAIAATQSAKPVSDIVKVECITCHRGLAIPKH